jgi:hypothetical protein
MEDISGYYKFTDEFPRVSDIEKWVSGYPDQEHLIDIITRSFDYIRKLPLSGISERYIQVEIAFCDPPE